MTVAAQEGQVGIDGTEGVEAGNCSQHASVREPTRANATGDESTINYSVIYVPQSFICRLLFES